MIKAIPTMYNGIQCRSILEAKWSCFFDLCGWKYQYEPTNFNGWIPDFVLYDKNEVYVEIKPITKHCERTMGKMIKSGCDTDMLLLGEVINPLSIYREDCNQFGWHRQVSTEREMDEVFLSAGKGYWSDAWFTYMNKKIGVCNRDGGWNDSLTGDYEGNCSLMMDGDYNDIILKNWDKACNKVQWMKK